MNRGPCWTEARPTRVCRKCDTERPVEMFGWTQSRWGGKKTSYRASYCLVCEPVKFNRGPNWSALRPTRVCRGACGAEKLVECFGWHVSRGRKHRASYCLGCWPMIARRYKKPRREADNRYHRDRYHSDAAYRERSNKRSTEYKRRIRHGEREDREEVV